MMKRFLLLLLTIAMLVAPAFAMAEPGDALYLLISRDENGAVTPLGSAVLFQDNATLLTTAWTLLPMGEGDLYALGKGGQIAINPDKVQPFSEGTVLLNLRTPSPAAPLALKSGSSAIYALGHDALGQPLRQEISAPAPVPYGDSAGLLYSVPQAMLPGSILVDGENLAAVTLAAYGEGVNRYMALTESVLAGTKPSSTWVPGFRLTLERGFATVNWSGCDLSCDRNDCVYSVFYIIEGNPYFSYILPDAGATSVRFPVVPGKAYQFFLQHAHGDIDRQAQFDYDAVSISYMIDPLPFTQYQYKDSEIYLSSTPIDGQDDFQNTYLPPMEITSQTLTDKNNAILLQVCSSYTVESNVEADLLLTLTTPEGYVFFTSSGFIFDTSLQEKDTWNIPIHGMLDDYLSFNSDGTLTPGEYTLRYYLNGDEANSYSWTLP